MSVSLLLLLFIRRIKFEYWTIDCELRPDIQNLVELDDDERDFGDSKALEKIMGDMSDEQITH